MAEEKKPKTRTLEEVTDHQAHHCVEIMQVRAAVQEMADAIALLSAVLQAKGLISADDINRVAAQIDKRNEETTN